MSKTIEIVEKYDYPIETLWKAITQPMRLKLWLLQTDFKAEVGHKFSFIGEPRSGWDGKLNGEVVLVKKPNRLTYSCNNAKAGIETIVSWNLVSEEEKTIVTLKQTGFDGWKGYFIYTTLHLAWQNMIKVKLLAALQHME